MKSKAAHNNKLVQHAKFNGTIVSDVKLSETETLSINEVKYFNQFGLTSFASNR